MGAVMVVFATAALSEKKMCLHGTSATLDSPPTAKDKYLLEDGVEQGATCIFQEETSLTDTRVTRNGNCGI